MEEDKKKEVFEWRKCINTLESGEPCNREFYISVAEKEYFDAKKDEKSGRKYQLPKRCYQCRVARRAANNGSNHEHQA